MRAGGPVAPTGDGGSSCAHGRDVRIRLDLSYDGAPFSGWAVQPGLRTVQGTVEDALAILLRRPARVTVAGRTDAGVHARGQVCHLDVSAAEWSALSRGRAIDPGAALVRRLGGVLSNLLVRGTAERPVPRRPELAGAIGVRAAAPAPPGFDARFAAMWRRYSYRIADDPGLADPLTRHQTLHHRTHLDTDRLNEAAARLLGEQDFLAFCKPRPGATTIRELQRFDFVRGPDGLITATVQADAFCHNMVRALVGAALLVGTGERNPGWLHDRLLARRRDSHSRIAPAHPLVLEEVRYPPEESMAARARVTRAVRSPQR